MDYLKANMKHLNMGRSDRGFTLIEMLIVIVIISFLVGIVLTGTLGFQASARDTRRVGDLRNAQSFLELYFNKCGRYPGDANCAASVPNWDALIKVMKDGNITAQFPKPIAGKDYLYGVSSDGLSYVVGVELERGNTVLDGDADGSVNNVDCGSAANDKIYCVTSG